MDGWLAQALEKLDLDPEVYSTYVMGILDDDDQDQSIEERLDSVEEILSGAVDEDLTSMRAELKQRYAMLVKKRQEEEAMEELARAEETKRKREEERREIEEAEQERAAKAQQGRSEEEMRERQRLLQAYAYAEDDGEDEDG
ncbi:unnamed protein product, partial [Chrysoparadoxa australica]